MAAGSLGAPAAAEFDEDRDIRPLQPAELEPPCARRPTDAIDERAAVRIQVAGSPGEEQDQWPPGQPPGEELQGLARRGIEPLDVVEPQHPGRRAAGEPCQPVGDGRDEAGMSPRPIGRRRRAARLDGRQESGQLGQGGRGKPRQSLIRIRQEQGGPQPLDDGAVGDGAFGRVGRRGQDDSARVADPARDLFAETSLADARLPHQLHHPARPARRRSVSGEDRVEVGGPAHQGEVAGRPPSGPEGRSPPARLPPGRGPPKRRGSASRIAS